MTSIPRSTEPYNGGDAENREMKNHEVLRNLVRDKKIFAVDLDGVVWRGNQLIPGADGCIAALREMGKQVVFTTNSSTGGRELVAEKIRRLGIPCRDADVFTALMATIHYLKKEPAAQKGVCCIGLPDMVKEVGRSGLKLSPPEDCGCLVIGYKLDLCSEDGELALRAWKNGARLIATNVDAYVPQPDGSIVPGCGFTVGAVCGVYGRGPDMIAGKPNTPILDLALESNGMTRADAVVIGDLYASDVAMAKAAGVPALWISEKEESGEADVYCIPSLRALWERGIR